MPSGFFLFRIELPAGVLLAGPPAPRVIIPSCLLTFCKELAIASFRRMKSFMFECGLAQCGPWAHNEEMVDWFAMQWEKITAVMEQAGCLGGSKGGAEK